MKLRAESFGGYLLRVALSALVLAALCALGVWLMPSQVLRVTLVALFGLSVACGAFWPEKGFEFKAFARKSAEVPVEPKPEAEREETQEEEPPTEEAPKRVRRQTGVEARIAAEAHEAQIAAEAEDPAFVARAFRLAREHRPDFYVRLGEYAWSRGAIVETHFWVSMAKYNGVEGLDGWLGEIQRHWMQAGRPGEEDNVYAQFPFRRGELARAHLMCLARVNAKASRDFIANMAQHGDREAQFLLATMPA